MFVYRSLELNDGFRVVSCVDVFYAASLTRSRARSLSVCVLHITRLAMLSHCLIARILRKKHCARAGSCISSTIIAAVL